MKKKFIIVFCISQKVVSMTNWYYRTFNISPFLDHFSSKFAQAFIPEKCISINKSKIHFKKRSLPSKISKTAKKGRSQKRCRMCSKREQESIRLSVCHECQSAHRYVSLKSLVVLVMPEYIYIQNIFRK